jgi:monomeric sarcosine oxidase
MFMTKPHVLVIGAGAFGGWTALELSQRGVKVTLIDAWGPGNARASSGGETRIIRATYGTRAVYTRMTLRAMKLWRAHDQRDQRGLFRQTGVLWLFGEDDRFGRASAAVLRAHDATLEQWSTTQAAARYPQVDFSDVGSIYFEPEAGYLLARRACESVVDCVVAEGGTYDVKAVAAPIHIDGGRAQRVTLTDGSTIEADAFVFACGPWLGSLFPDVIGDRLLATRQEVYYFGAPAGDSRFTDSQLPVWIDIRDRQIYGIPASGRSGFKVADDVAGPVVDPTTLDRRPSDEGVALTRAFLSRRFPALRDAPLIKSEVCQYESTPDSHLIMDRHPQVENVWLVGGGSGHGFKLGPVVGEMVASLVLGESRPDPLFGLTRFLTPPPDGWDKKWS